MHTVHTSIHWYHVYSYAHIHGYTRIQGHKEVCHMHMIAKCKKCSQIVLVSQPICAWGVCGCGCVWVVWGGVLGQLVRVIHDAHYIYGHLQKKNNFHKYIYFFHTQKCTLLSVNNN